MNLNSKEGLIQRLSSGSEARERFVSSQLDKFIAFQIRALRDREGMSQTALADKLGSTQNSISRFESPNKGRPTITTLKKIAAVFDVGLEVRFVPFAKLINFTSGTPYQETGLSTESYYVPSFDTDPNIFSQPSAMVDTEFAAASGQRPQIQSGRLPQLMDQVINSQGAGMERMPPRSATDNLLGTQRQEGRGI